MWIPALCQIHDLLSHTSTRTHNSTQTNKQAADAKWNSNRIETCSHDVSNWSSHDPGSIP